MTPNPTPQVFLFLSRIIGKRILDADGRKCGRVLDLIISVAELYPLVTGILYRPGRGKDLHRLSWDRVREVREVLRVDSPAEANGEMGR